MKDLVQKLPMPGQPPDRSAPSNATLSAVLGVLYETILRSADFTRFLHDNGGTDRLRSLANSPQYYSARVVRYAGQVSDCDCHSSAACLPCQLGGYGSLGLVDDVPAPGVARFVPTEQFARVRLHGPIAHRSKWPVCCRRGDNFGATDQHTGPRKSGCQSASTRSRRSVPKDRLFSAPDDIQIDILHALTLLVPLIVRGSRCF